MLGQDQECHHQHPGKGGEDRDQSPAVVCFKFCLVQIHPDEAEVLIVKGQFFDQWRHYFQNAVFLYQGAAQNKPVNFSDKGGVTALLALLDIGYLFFESLRTSAKSGILKLLYLIFFSS